MIRSRGMSTPIDVAVGLLLVGAAVAVLSGIQPPATGGVDPNGAVLLGTSHEVPVEIEGETWTVSGTMGGLIGDAVLASREPTSPREAAFVVTVRETVDQQIERTGAPIQIVGFCRGPAGPTPLVMGSRIPPEGTVGATLYEVPAGRAGAHEGDDHCMPAVVVRWWEP